MSKKLISLHSRWRGKRQPDVDGTNRDIDNTEVLTIEQFYDVCGENELSQEGLKKSEGTTSVGFSANEKKIYEEHMASLQEQLVSTMIENQNLVEELKQMKENMTYVELKQQLEQERQKNLKLVEQLHMLCSSGGDNKPLESKLPKERTSVTNGHGDEDMVEIMPKEKEATKKRSLLEQFVERSLESMYNVMELFNDVTKPEDSEEAIVEPLKVKTLKDNITRFKTALRPYISTFKGYQNLVTWKSKSYTFIVFFMYMYSVWSGWFLPLSFFLAAVRIVFSYLHFRNVKFQFSYLDSGELEKESEDSLGLSDKFNLVLQVATKVQNGLGLAADSLEKLKNLFTWRHQKGTIHILKILGLGCIMSAILPTSVLWKCIGFAVGVKIFITGYIYSKFPQLQKKYDFSYQLWESLPTDGQYDKLHARSEMDKYIVVPRSQCDREISTDVESSGSDFDCNASNDIQEFRQLFSLPMSECLVKGWLHGKRSVLISKSRSFITLLSRKIGKLYLTSSFLCFKRENSPSVRNIVVPLEDITSIDKIKIHQRIPGRGMAIQIVINTDGKINVLRFGGIIKRDEVIKSIEQTMAIVKVGKNNGDTVRKRSSSSSINTASRIQNFTFGAYYQDSE